MALPKRISDMPITAHSDNCACGCAGCMECGGPGLADSSTNPNWEGDMYYLVEGDIFCSVDCVERWHGIELE